MKYVLVKGSRIFFKGFAYTAGTAVLLAALTGGEVKIEIKNPLRKS